MQVYKITPTTEYSWGCALISANNEKEAIRTYLNDYDDNIFYYDEFKCVCNIVDKLTYDCIEPTVILDTIGGE